MAENKLADISTEFAVKSANIREAKYALLIASINTAKENAR